MRSDGIPKSFQLAGHTIKVVFIPKTRWKNGKDAIGMWLPDAYRIEIVNGLSPTSRQQVFCHEFMHALLDVACYHKMSEDEILVDRLAHLLAQAMTSFA